MTRVTPARVEQITLIVGGCLMVAAVLAVDWRLGLFLAGMLLCASALNWRRA